MIKLGVNIDHVATLRQARKETFPDPIAAALEAVEGGAEGITAHLREDRRHIQDHDIKELKKQLSVPLNMEMAASLEIIRFAVKIKPEWTCLVPEKREELTTEGGLNLKANVTRIQAAIQRLQGAGIKVSLFIDPSVENAELAKELEADAVEFHTGTYARLWPKIFVRKELALIEEAAKKAKSLGLIVNAGHGINYENAADLIEMFPFNEFNIGFAIVARAVSVGMKTAVQEMKQRMNA